MDNDGDGVQDGAPIATALSDGDTGNYCFEDIEPRDYVVVEVQPVNYDDVDDYDRSITAGDPDGDDSQELADNNIPVTLSPGEADENNDFIDDPFPGTINGRVTNQFNVGLGFTLIELFADTNSDGRP